MVNPWLKSKVPFALSKLVTNFRLRDFANATKYLILYNLIRYIGVSVSYWG